MFVVNFSFRDQEKSRSTEYDFFVAVDDSSGLRDRVDVITSELSDSMAAYMDSPSSEGVSYSEAIKNVMDASGYRWVTIPGKTIMV